MHVRNARLRTTASILAVAIAAVGLVGLTSVAEGAALVGPLKAVVTLAPTTSTVNQPVTASAAKSTVPSGDTLSAITLNWGDGSKAVTLPTLATVPSHRYQHPGRFTVALNLTDHKGTHVSGTALEVVTAPTGSFTGSNPQTNYPITFYVSADRTKLQDVYISWVVLTCAPGGTTVNDHLGIGSIALNADGSFSQSTTQVGVQAGHTATFGYTFAGRISGVTSTGAPKVTGTFRETLAFTDTAARTCTSNNQAWTATRDAQPAQTTTPAPVGSYRGYNPQTNYPITFYVSADRTKLQDVYASWVVLTCAPGGSTVNEHVSIASIPLLPDGSFNSVTTQAGVYAGYPATYTYTFKGNVHGVDKNGTPRVAGMLREDLAFTDTTARTCTSNLQSWTAIRDSQPAQPTSAPPAGSYTASNPQTNYPITFYVSADRTKLQDVYASWVVMTCAPGGATVNDHLGIGTIALNADGSFNQTTTQTGVYAGYPATFTYTFAGNVHGVDANGTPRLSGILREKLAFTDTAARSCTSNNQSWTALRDSQPAQPTSLPPVGNYAGTNPQNNYPMTFRVAGSTALQTIDIASVGMTCSPGNATVTDHFTIAGIALNADGSFATTSVRSGLVSGHAATFTYTFKGNFHGVDKNGVRRAAGSFREDVSYTDTAARSCTSNNQSWTAALTSLG